MSSPASRLFHPLDPQFRTQLTLIYGAPLFRNSTVCTCIYNIEPRVKTFYQLIKTNNLAITIALNDVSGKRNLSFIIYN